MTLRRETIGTMLAFLVIGTALPFAIVGTIETGRVYLFSTQFHEELQRFTRHGRLRFILQPTAYYLHDFLAVDVAVHSVAPRSLCGR